MPDFADLEVSGPGAASRAAVVADGTVSVWLDVKKELPDLPQLLVPPRRIPEVAVDINGGTDCPPLNIVIFVVGSRGGWGVVVGRTGLSLTFSGDVQPYLALALRLIETNGHRVRIATHPSFKDLVLGGNKLLGKSEQFGNLAGRLEFFDVGGDPKELMAYMVKSGCTAIHSRVLTEQTRA